MAVTAPHRTDRGASQEGRNMSLTSGEQLNLAMKMREEFFLLRSHQGYPLGPPSSYSVSVDVVLEIVKWFEQQQEAHTEAAITDAVQSYSTRKESDESQIAANEKARRFNSDGTAQTHVERSAQSGEGDGGVQEGNAEEQQRHEGHEQEASNRDRQE